MSFVVIAMHSTAHGELGSPILITSDPKLAVETARKAETLGYTMNSLSAEVYISQLAENHVYAKDTAEVVFIRRKENEGWSEVWLSKRFKKKYEGVPEPATPV